MNTIIPKRSTWTSETGQSFFKARQKEGEQRFAAFFYFTFGYHYTPHAAKVVLKRWKEQE